MALIANDERAAAARLYFASLGELASKIIQESDSIRNRSDWNGLTNEQKEQSIDRHFVDEAVVDFYADRNSTGAQATSPSVGADGSVIGDLPTWEMLYPRPIPIGGQKFVHVGAGEDGESSAPSYVDEFAGHFQWQTKSQLELWLPEGKSLPSPRAVRKSMYKDDSRTRIDAPRFGKVPSIGSASSQDGEGLSTSTSVRAMAQALQRTSGGKPPQAGGNRISSTALAPLQGSPAGSPSIAKASGGLHRAVSASHVKNSPDVAPKPPKRSSSIVGDSPSPQLKAKASGVLAGPPAAKSAGIASGPLQDDSADPLGGAGKSPRPSPPVRRDSLSKKTGSPYAQAAAAAAAENDTGYAPGTAINVDSASGSASISMSRESPGPPPSAAASYSPKVEKPQRAPPSAPTPAASLSISRTQEPSNPSLSNPPALQPLEPPSQTSKETTFPSSPDPLDDSKVVGFANTQELAESKGFDFLSNW